MADEDIDLLDITGKTIGVISKHKAHRTGAWHKSAHCWMFNPDKKLGYYSYVQIKG